ncbi:hypothetical protein KUCAC02_001824 [Chaenocephalus aceratus]|uniref:Uncharacterized protein n=1 Tax=Chaenocephalus aceratus TaxID=36190 RepID=A0ACB9XU34_CHAAC|nr:hypothetical protein KUCAC02_001824 [Chaenocephalus aceratus]
MSVLSVTSLVVTWKKTRLYSLLYYFILNSPFMICANAAFTEVPKDVSVGEGEDVEMPCAFKAVSAAPMSLEIQWWYLKEDVPGDLHHELQISAPAHRAKVVPREATKISTVRVQGQRHLPPPQPVQGKEGGGGVYECRVSDLWADESQDFTVHAMLHVSLGDGMVAEEAVSHIQNRWPLRNTNTALGGAQGGGPPRSLNRGWQGVRGQGRGGSGCLSRPSPASSPPSPPPPSPPWPSHPLPPCRGTQPILRQQLGAGEWEREQSHSDP